jgi:hypothetical protein
MACHAIYCAKNTVSHAMSVDDRSVMAGWMNQSLGDSVICETMHAYINRGSLLVSEIMLDNVSTYGC